MGIQSMDLAWIVVSDLNSAVRFYSDVVGLKLSSLSEEYGWAEMVAETGKFRLGIAQKNDMDGMDAGVNAVLTLTVKDIDASIKELSSKGARMLGDIMEIPGEVKLQTLADNDGNRMQLVQVLRK